MRGHTYDRIRLRVKLLKPMQRLHGDAVLLQLLGVSGKILLRDVLEKMLEIRRLVQYAGLQHSLQFLPFLFLLRTWMGDREGHGGMPLIFESWRSIIAIRGKGWEDSINNAINWH